MRMKGFLVFALLSCFAIPFVAGTRFVCYFPNWTRYRKGDGTYEVSNIDPYLCTDLVYSFNILNATTYKMQSHDSWNDIDQNGYSNFLALKTLNPQLKTTIAIGGWDDSHDGTNKYSNMVASPGNRKIFVDSVVEFLELYKFDGLDLDWEYPSGDSDKAGFAELLKELRDALGTKLLTVAVAANSTLIDAGYDVAVMAEKADYINLMAYDMHGPWEPKTDHHAPLHKRSWETIDNNIEFIVEYWISKGLPAHMINLGIPLYGKSWILGEKVEPGYQVPGVGNGGPPGPLTGAVGFLGYNEICNSIHADGWESVDDPNQQNGPYAYSPSDPKTWVSYDDTKMAVVKSNYVIDHFLGGAMVWDISTDDFHNKCGEGANPVMTTISDTVVKAGSRFICYFPNWAYYRPGDGKYVVDNINPNLCTDMVYAFAILDASTYKITEYDTTVDLGANQFYAKFVDLKKQNPSLKTTIAIGGWDDSHDGTNKYSSMVASSSNRKIFVDSVMEFLEKYKFDGLDIDWEYPASQSDKDGLSELMKELRAEFDAHTPQYSLTIAVGVNKTISDLGYDIPVLAQTADYINIMAYDMHGPWEPLTDHHAPLYQRDWDTDATNNIDAVVRYWVVKGMPSSKLMLGIPLYGKTWTLGSIYTEDPTLPAPGSGPGAQGPITAAPGTLGYNEICKYVKTENWEVVVDPEFQIGPYASSPNVPKTWVGYDDPVMAHVKSLYLLGKGLGGAMVWDMSTDDFKNLCGDGPNPIMTNISRTVGVSTSTTTTTKTTAGGTSTTSRSSSGSPTTTVPTTPRPSTTRLSTWPRVTTAWTTQVTNSKVPFNPSNGHRIASSFHQLIVLSFGLLLIYFLI